MGRRMEYQGVLIRALAYLIYNVILFALFALFHFLVLHACNRQDGYNQC